MRAWWILPNRDQRDDILASDGKAVQPLRKILDPKFRPEGFSHAVPAELIEKCGPKALGEILFAQSFPGRQGAKRLFCVSTPAGADASGRVVSLGLLFILEPHARPRFELPYAGLSGEDQMYAAGLNHRLNSSWTDDAWARSVCELAELQAARAPATNVALERSAVRFHALYEIGPDGLRRASGLRKKAGMIALVGLILLAAAGLWLNEYAHARTPHSTLGSGGVTWRLS